MKEIGQVLRRARESRGLTLRQASNLSEGAFPPTSIASYERGERAISVERFCRLAAVYRVSPARLIAEIVRRHEHRPAAEIHVHRLGSLEAPEARIVGGFIREVAHRRGEAAPEVVRLRTGDLEVIATASGRSPEELLEAIGPALADA